MISIRKRVSGLRLIDLKKKNAPNMFIALKTTRMMTERLISITYSLRFCF